MTAPERAVEKAEGALDRLDAQFEATFHAWSLDEDPATARTPPTPVTNADRARAALDAVWPETTVLVQHAKGLIEHTYAGACPHADDPDTRDPECPVCAAIDALGEWREVQP